MQIKTKSNSNRLASWFAIAIVILFLSVLPLGLSKQYINLLTLSGIFAVAVLGMELLMGFTGLLSLGQAGFMAIGAYTTAILTVDYNMSPLIALLLAQLLTLVFALIIGKAVLRLRGYHLALATLAFSIIMQQLLTNLRELTGGPSGLAGVPALALGNLTLAKGLPFYYLIMVIVALIYFLLRNLLNCRVGRAWVAVAGDELAAATLGINTSRYKLVAFIISASLAALSGSFYAHYMQFIAPEMVGMSASINLVIMSALGGPGTLWGPLLGTLLLTMLPNFIAFAQNYQLLLFGVIFLVTIVFFPGGLAGLTKMVYRKLANICSNNVKAVDTVKTVDTVKGVE